MRAVMRALALGRLIGTLLVLIVGLGVWAVSALTNALLYTAVKAEVDRVEVVCVPAGAPIQSAMNCVEAQALSGGKRLARRVAVYVRYTSPADGRVYSGMVMPAGSRKAAEAIKLRPGTPLKILAHDRHPEEIKAE